MRKLLKAGSVLCASFVLFVACGEKQSLEACPEGEIFSAGKCFQDLGVSVNGVGMLPERKKQAVFADTAPEFQVINVETGQAVHTGTAVGPQTARDTEQVVYLADFSVVTQPGTYIVETASGKKSAQFEIGSQALEAALDLSMLGMYGQRCGVEVEFRHAGERFHHAACHLDPASLEDVGGGSADDTGGWHDAGDYGKYVVNGAFAVAFLMAAYEHFPDYLKAREFEMPERGGATPDILDEARVEITWILKTQLADGSFSHKVTARGFEAEIMPETDHQARFFYSVSTAATGDGTAALAQAARVFAEFDPGFAETCLAAAQKGQAFLDLHPELIESKQTSGGTGTYATGRDQDARIWALAELWATTSDASYLSSLETRLAEASFSDEFDWGNATNLGLGTYLRSELPGRDPKIVEKLTASVAASAQKLHQGALEDVYGRDRESYYWGTNGVISRTAYNLALANSLFGHTDFLDTISLQLGHVFGLNGFGRSYVTQLGPNPVVSPHHRPSTADTAGRPWPGLMIGGPHGQGADERGTKGVVLPALDWQDKISNYYHNEIAINWNTALIYALVAALATQDGQTDACWPDTCFTVPGAPDGGTGGSGGAGGGAN